MTLHFDCFTFNKISQFLVILPTALLSNRLNHQTNEAKNHGSFLANKVLKFTTVCFEIDQNLTQLWLLSLMSANGAFMSSC